MDAPVSAATLTFSMAKHKWFSATWQQVAFFFVASRDWRMDVLHESTDIRACT